MLENYQHGRWISNKLGQRDANAHLPVPEQIDSGSDKFSSSQIGWVGSEAMTSDRAAGILDESLARSRDLDI